MRARTVFRSSCVLAIVSTCALPALAGLYSASEVTLDERGGTGSRDGDAWGHTTWATANYSYPYSYADTAGWGMCYTTVGGTFYVSFTVDACASSLAYEGGGGACQSEAEGYARGGTPNYYNDRSASCESYASEPSEIDNDGYDPPALTWSTTDYFSSGTGVSVYHESSAKSQISVGSGASGQASGLATTSCYMAVP